MVEGGPDGAGMGDSEREAVDHQYYEEDENPYGTDLFARTDLFYGNPDEAIDGLDETHGGNFMGSGMHHHSSYCLLYTSPSPRDKRQSRMPSSA